MRQFKSWVDLITHYLERVDVWLDRSTKPVLRLPQEKSSPYMTGRIVYCANCEKNSTLWRHEGTIRCSSCNSTHWDCPGKSIKIIFVHQDERSPTNAKWVIS